MISSEHLSKRIDQYLNKSGTNDQFKISVPDKVRAINSAQLVLVKRKIGLNNVYKMGFESFRKRFDDLDFLIQKEIEMNITKSNNNLVVSTTHCQIICFTSTLIALLIRVNVRIEKFITSLFQTMMFKTI